MEKERTKKYATRDAREGRYELAKETCICMTPTLVNRRKLFK